ncbi:MAG: hypothetical protein GWO88_00420 [Planctomycetia bacterium]|nr:hypothetical protein [Planctomycetia bacterium]
MIYEVINSTLKPGYVKKWEASFCKALPARSRHSSLGGLWHTDIGPLNEIVQIWPYESVAHRAEVQAKVKLDPDCPPDGNESIVHWDTQIFTPVPFSPQLGGEKQLGGIYEMRIYQFKAGSIQTVIERFKPAIEGGRLDLSPLAVMMYSETGVQDSLMHIWPYKDFATRDQVRHETGKLKTWPPDIGEFLLSQQNKILIPAACSPMK